jgi:DNA-binding CsgD family transcriptional regulator
VLAWSLQPGGDHALGLRLAGILAFWLWRQRGHLSEGRRWMERVLAAAASAPSSQADLRSARTRALTGAALLADAQRDLPAAMHLAQESLAIARDLDDTVAIAWALIVISRVLHWWRHFERNTVVLAESLSRFRAAGDQGGCAYALFQSGAQARVQGEHERAAASFAESVACARLSGDPWVLLAALQWQARQAWLMGNIDLATAWHRESLSISHALRAPWPIAINLIGLAAIADVQGASARAVRLFAAAAAIRDALGVQLPIEYTPREAQSRSSMRATLGERALDVATAEGRAMTMAQAVEYGLSTDERAWGWATTLGQLGPPETGGHLSARELEVATLIGQGHSYRRVADLLVISPRTVEVHARNIREKLRLSSHADLVMWAAREAPRPSESDAASSTVN